MNHRFGVFVLHTTNYDLLMVCVYRCVFCCAVSAVITSLSFEICLQNRIFILCNICTTVFHTVNISSIEVQLYVKLIIYKAHED